MSKANSIAPFVNRIAESDRVEGIHGTRNKIRNFLDLTEDGVTFSQISSDQFSVLSEQITKRRRIWINMIQCLYKMY